VAIFRALEASADPRTIPVARDAVTEGGDVAVAAVAALGALVDGASSPAPTDALDILIAAALDTSLERRVRLAAFQAIQHIPQVGDKVAGALQDDPDGGIHAGALDVHRDRAAADAAWQDALDGRLPDDPALLREIAL